MCSCLGWDWRQNQARVGPGPSRATTEVLAVASCIVGATLRKAGPGSKPKLIRRVSPVARGQNPHLDKVQPRRPQGAGPGLVDQPGVKHLGFPPPQIAGQPDAQGLEAPAVVQPDAFE